MPTYICSTEGHGVEVTADSPEEAAKIYVDDGDWGPRERTTWIHVYVEEMAPDGELMDGGTERVELPPDVPPCVDGRRHRFGRETVWGSGAGTVTTSTCRWCGVQWAVNSWGQDPYDGSQGHTVESYAEKDPNFVPRPFLRYPDIFAWGEAKLEEGDVVKISNEVGDYKEAVFRLEPSDDPWGWTLVRLWDHEENAELDLLPQESKYSGLPLIGLVDFWEDDPNNWVAWYLGREINSEEETEEVAYGS